MDDYAQYVKANIAVGMIVRCRQAYKNVRVGDIGRVMKLDDDGLHDLNVQADWLVQGGTYWVRFIDCQLVVSFKPGDKVRVKPSIHRPK